MASTKIKGHRIEDKSIEDKHLKDGLKFKEGGRVVLNFPTHSNAADLSIEEKNILTQHGNADNLHYHTGGGGGPEGIYTNEERDAQLLKLNLMVNSARYKIDKSVRDTLDTDDSVDYGLLSAPAPLCTVYSDNPAISGVLPPEKEYTYAVVYTNKYGATNITASSTVKTSTGLNNAVSLLLQNVPVTNTGFEIYRTEEEVATVVGEFDSYNKFINDQYLRFNLDYGDKTSGMSSLRFIVKGNDATREYNSYADMLLGSNKYFSPKGENISTIVSKPVPYEYIIFNMNKVKSMARLDVIWGPEPNLVPQDYELYYTDDPDTIYGFNVTWKKLDFINKKVDYRNNELNISTDGIITENTITNNSRCENVFIFDKTRDIMALKIVVTRTLNDVRLFALRGMSEPQGDNTRLMYKLDAPISLSEYKSLSFDIKSNGDNKKLVLALSNSKDSDINTSTITTIVNSNNTTSYNVGYPYTMCRAYINQAWANSYDKYDKMRIGIRAVPNQYIEFDNVFMIIGSTYNGSTFSPKPIVNIPITFDGKYEYNAIAPSDGLIWSDWFDCPWSSSTYTHYSSSKIFTTSLFLKSGKLCCYGSGTSYYQKSAVGMEDVPYIGDMGMSGMGSGSFVQQLQVAKSSSPRVDVKANYTYSADDYNVWQRHIVAIPKCPEEARYDTLTIMAMDGITTGQTFYVDNVKATRKEEIKTGVTPIGSKGFTNIPNIILDNSTIAESQTYPAQLAPQCIGLSFNEIKVIDSLKIMYGVAAYRGTQYSIQYTDALDADINDLYTDEKWKEVTRLSVGDVGAPSPFTGQVIGSMVYNNNLYAHMVNHSFDPVSAKAIRVVVFSVNNSEVPLRCSRIAAYNYCESGEFNLIYKHNTKVSENHVFTDDGKPSQTIKPSDINTTGSNGVAYDRFLNVVKLVDGVNEGTVYFKPIKMPLYKHILTTAQYTGDIKFYISNDGGLSFYPVALEKLHSFSSQSESLTAKAVMRGKNASINALAYLYTL